MKSKIILLVLFFSMLFSLKAQYESFFGEIVTFYQSASFLNYENKNSKNSDWNLFDSLGLSVMSNSYGFYTSDTIRIGNHIYLYHWPVSEYEEDGYIIREETNTGKLFRYSQSIGKDILICDMSLNEGDTFHLFPQSAIPEAWWNNYPEAGITLIVDSVTYVNGKKVIWFPQINSSSIFFNTSEQYIQYDVRLKFVEGIGPTYGPFGFSQLFPDHFLPLLLCVSKDHDLVFMLNETLGCNQTYVGIDEAELADVQVYPNPGSDQITIKTDHFISNQTSVSIYNSLGFLVYSGKYESGESINISQFANGLYLVVLQNGTQKLLKKFIKVK